MLRLQLLLALFATTLVSLSQVHAQMFQHFFGGGGNPFGHREQESPATGDAAWFEARVEAATCTDYLCPRTLSCVQSPSQCPCPFPQQHRCPYPDAVTGSLEQGGHVCVQSSSCQDVQVARALGSDFKLSDLTS